MKRLVKQVIAKFSVGAAAVAVAMCVAAEANAAVSIANGSFESVQGPGSTPIGGIELANDWVGENLATVGGIQNATWTVDQEGVTASQITGDRWGRLVSDVDLRPGGLYQNIGSLSAGQSVIIKGDYFTGGNPGPVIPYEPIIELYNGSPTVFPFFSQVVATAVLAGGALDGATNNSSTFTLSYTPSSNQNSLFLRLRSNATTLDPANVTRGGVDNIRVVIPEPATCALAGLGFAVVGGFARRRRSA